MNDMFQAIFEAIDEQDYQQIIRMLQKEGKSSKEELLGNPTTQRVFKYLSIIVVSILLYCLPGFYRFRQHCISKGYYVFSTSSFMWTAVGFFGVFISKYLTYYLLKSTVERNLNEKYEGEAKIYKVRSTLKFCYDFIFYLSVSLWAYYLFKDQYWFPVQAGGSGQCGLIYKQYPNWPQNSASNLQMYFLTQLGVHLFSVFEIIFIKRKTERKFYEFLLHHFLAASLILFSMMCNEITAGALILIIHDMSDFPLAFSKAYLETKYISKFFSGILYVVITFSWIYNRIIIYPTCMLANVFANRPTPADEWYMINFEYNYLLFMAFILLGMHFFWTYFLLKLGFQTAMGKEFKNVHDDVSKKK